MPKSLCCRWSLPCSLWQQQLLSIAQGMGPEVARLVLQLGWACLKVPPAAPHLWELPFPPQAMRAAPLPPPRRHRTILDPVFRHKGNSESRPEELVIGKALIFSCQAACVTSRINTGRGQLTGNADCRNLGCSKRPHGCLSHSWALPTPTGSDQSHLNHPSSQRACLCLGHHSTGRAPLSKLKQSEKTIPVLESRCFCMEVQEVRAGASSEESPWTAASASDATSSGHLLTGLSPGP